MDNGTKFKIDAITRARNQLIEIADTVLDETDCPFLGDAEALGEEIYAHIIKTRELLGKLREAVAKQ